MTSNPAHQHCERGIETTVNSEIQERLLELDKTINSLLAPGTAAPFQVLSWIDIRLRQMGLQNNFDALEILSEAYIRTQKAIKNGEKIQSYIAWIRSTCFLIIKEKRTELSREKANLQKANSSILANQKLTKEETESSSLEEEIPFLKKAWTILNLKDKELLKLRFADNLSWKDIQKNTDNKISIPTLRKRGERAIGKLRNAFHSEKEKGGENHVN